jgi:hypothetical protein
MHNAPHRGGSHWRRHRVVKMKLGAAERIASQITASAAM